MGDGRELSEEEVDAVTGGDAHRIKPTHEEIDRAWNTIQTVQDKYGVSVANYRRIGCTSFQTIRWTAADNLT